MFMSSLKKYLLRQFSFLFFSFCMVEEGLWYYKGFWLSLWTVAVNCVTSQGPFSQPPLLFQIHTSNALLISCPRNVAVGQ